MPRVTLPPTPASSTDITGQKGAQRLSSLEMSFLLPPPAIAAKGNNRNPASTLHSQSTITSADFSLPPPPTRSRKIIQMKPKPKQMEDSGSPTNPKPAHKNAGKKAASSTTSTLANKKQPSLTSAAGKKMARKTAHSVIERRRRSKMNEEFGVLKDLIPACKDQDMHKLAILQASIDYLRYLEQCISNLQAASSSMSNPIAQPHAPPRLNSSFSPETEDNEISDDDDDDDDDEDQDQEMANSGPTVTTPAFSALNAQSRAASAYESPQSIHTSPALDPTIPHLTSSSSYASTTVSTLPSPAYGPQHTPLHGPRFGGYTTSATTSPMLLPDPKHPDHEATAALLMLNQQDRRNLCTGRGMSVKDLLSS